MEQGKIVTDGPPLDVISNPLRSAAAQKQRFENIFDATVVELREQDGTMVCELTGTSIRVEAPLAQIAVGSEVCVGIRADEILVASSQPAILGDCNVIRGKLTRVERTGAIVEARVSCGAEFRVRLAPRSIEPHGLETSADLWLMIRTRACHLVRSSLFEALQRLFVFVCQGNTIRSPIAQAICNTEIAARLGVPLESLEGFGIQAVSAGLTARPGAPLAAEAEQALGAIGIPALQHRSRNLTHAMAQRAEVIFCMTEEQRTEVTARFPEAIAKTYCLHPDADVSFPHDGKSADAFSDMAREIQGLIGQKLDDLGVPRSTSPAWAPPAPAAGAASIPRRSSDRRSARG
jgi:protein-tyrosine-phosphatase